MKDFFKKFSRISVKRDSSGASMVEFALVVPFLMLLVSGTLELGRTLSECVWQAQTLYNVTMDGAIADQNSGSLAMIGRLSQLRTVKDTEHPSVISSVSDPLPLFGSSFYDNDPARRLIGVSMVVNVQPIASLDFQVPLNFTIVSPYLRMNNAPSGSLNSFAQPGNYYYDCNMQRCANPGAPCATSCLTNCTQASPGGSTIGSESCTM